MKKALGRIYLIGYMASGKSTVGKLLAESLDLQFIDLDQLIEERAGMTIKEIFQQYGETSFRQLESSALFQCSKKENIVVATGGGAPCFNDNMSLISTTGRSIYLNLDETEILNRLIHDGSSRPLVAQKSESELITYVKVHLDSRKPFYEMAEHIIDASDTPKEIVVKIKALMES